MKYNSKYRTAKGAAEFWSAPSYPLFEGSFYQLKKHIKTDKQSKLLKLFLKKLRKINKPLWHMFVD